MPKNNSKKLFSNKFNNSSNNRFDKKLEHFIDYNSVDFNLIRVATVSPIIHLGNISQNVFEIQNTFEKLNQNNVNIAVFPELTLTGYTIGDLIFQREILENAKLGISKLAKLSEEVNSILIVGLPLEINNRIFNVAAVIYNGEILGFVPKTYLSNSREYYEERWFATTNDLTDDFVLLDGNKYIIGNDLVFSIINQSENNINNYLKFGIEICEDLWSIKPPSDDLALNGAELIFNLSTSSEVMGKSDYRKNLVKMQSAKTMSAYIYCSSNMFEASNDLTFAGHNIIAENGEVLLESEKFNFDGEFNLVDIDLDVIRTERTKNHTFGRTKASKKSKEIIFEYSGFDSQNLTPNTIYRFVEKDVFFKFNSNKDEFVKNIIDIQSNALISKLKKINNPIESSKVVIGVSGGLDSTYALLITQIAFLKAGIDPQNIFALTMPGLGTSEGTKSSALSLAQFLYNSLLEIPINQAVELHFRDLNYDQKSLNTVFENSQARERTQILMDFANNVNGIVIGTGDLSELAIGWCTYNADHVSMFNLNGGIPKTIIKFIIEYFSDVENLKKYDIIQNKDDNDYEKFCSLLNLIANTEVSPELLPLENGEITQKTEEIVGPYELIDFFLFYFVKYGFKPSKILFYSEIAFENIYDKTTLKKWLNIFLKRFFASQYKRNLMPDTIKVFPIALSPRGDWRAPSELDFNNWLEELEGELDDELDELDNEFE